MLEQCVILHLLFLHLIVLQFRIAYESNNGMASQVNISQENIQNALIPFPNINEQNRIVEKLQTLIQ